MRNTSSAYSSYATDIESSIFGEAVLRGQDPYSYLSERNVVDSSVTTRSTEPVRVNVDFDVSVFSGKEVTSWIPEELQEPPQEAFNRQRELTRVRDIEFLLAIAPYQIPRTFSEPLVERLRTLAEEPEEPDEQPMSPDSLRHFLGFLSNWIAGAPDLRRPEIAISFEGNIGIEWRSGQGELLGVEFLPNGDVRFVIFVRNARNPERIERLSGILSVDRLRKILVEVGVLAWCRDG